MFAILEGNKQSRRWYVPRLLAAIAVFTGVAYGASAAMPSGAQAATVAVRINAGSSTELVDSLGRTWSADAGYIDGYTLARGPIPIAGTSNPDLFRTERWGLTGYRISVPNGRYEVRLHFAETDTGVTGPGQRVFGAEVQGISLGDLDIYALAGERNRATSRQVRVNVSTGQVAIDLTPKVQSAMINGIEILPLAALPTPTPVPATSPTAVSSTPVPPTPTPSTSCTATLQSLIDAAASGSVLKVPACVYRESVSLNKPLTLDGQGAAEIRGSDVWTGWTPAGTTWISSATVPTLPQHGQCKPGVSCQLSEQVFLNARRLSRITSGTPSSGQFTLDSGRHVIIADNPSGHVIEVTTRPIWIQVSSDNVTVQNFSMRHAADYGISVNAAAVGVVIQSNTLAWAHYADVAANNAGVNVLNNDIGFGGCLGVATSPRLMQGNKIHDNNTDGYDPGWEAGGVKTAFTTGAIWDNNEVYNNDGVGLWSDIHGNSITISNNRIHDNTLHGILYEESVNGRIFGNSIWRNGAAYPYYGGGSGIFLSTSQNTDVHDNYIAWNGSGIAVLSADRGAEFLYGQNYVHSNSIILGRDTYGLEFIATRGDDHGDHNAYWYPTGENGAPRFTYASDYNQLSAFVATRGDSLGRYLSDPEKSSVLATHGMSLTP